MPKQKKISKKEFEILAENISLQADLLCKDQFKNIALIKSDAKYLGVVLAEKLGLYFIDISEADPQKTLLVTDVVSSGDTIRPYQDQNYFIASLIVKSHAKFNNYRTLYGKLVDKNVWVSILKFKNLK